MTHMDDKTNLTPEQDEVQTGEEVSFTISGEDAAAQEALNAKKTAKKKSPLPWIIGGAAVVVAAALVLILTLKPKTVSPDAEQPGDATISEPADTPDGTDKTIRPLRRTARPANRRTAKKPSPQATV